MPRLTAALALFLAVSLSACDVFSEVDPPVAAEVTVGATYEGTTLALRDAASGEVLYDYLAGGAEIAAEFVDDDSFTARLFVPYEALVASGETDDVDGDVDEALAGAYRVEDGAVTFEPDGFSDTFFTDPGWTVDADGGAVRYVGGGEDVEVVVVLTRR